MLNTKLAYVGTKLTYVKTKLAYVETKLFSFGDKTNLFEYEIRAVLKLPLFGFIYGKVRLNINYFRFKMN